MRPELVQQAWDYFRNVQTKDQKYIPFISDKDQPALWLNEKIMQKYAAGDEEAVLRPDQVQDLSRAARNQIPHGQIRQV